MKALGIVLVMTRILLTTIATLPILAELGTTGNANVMHGCLLFIIAVNVTLRK